MKIRLGTRGSALALKQAEMTEAALAAAWPELEVERVVIKTTGDRRTDIALKDVAAAEAIVDKGVFIKELEVALQDGEIDFAVHSLKDVPTVFEDEFELVCFLERAPVSDVLLTKVEGGLNALPAGATVGTSSVRRARQLTFLRPDLKIVDLRGNVPTRLEKLASQEELDGIMLAEAGLRRLNYSIDEVITINSVDLYAQILADKVFYPAAGQGAVAMEVRKDDRDTRVLLEKISHADTQKSVTAEREFLRLLDAGCHTPVGVWTRHTDSGLSMGARVFSEQDLKAQPRHAECSGADPIETGRHLFEALR